MRYADEVFDELEALPVKEAARLLHVSEPTIRKHIKTGELPGILIGRCRRVRRVDLEAFLQARTAYGWQRETASPRPAGDLSMEDDCGGNQIPF